MITLRYSCICYGCSCTTYSIDLGKPGTHRPVSSLFFIPPLHSSGVSQCQLCLSHSRHARTKLHAPFLWRASLHGCAQTTRCSLLSLVAGPASLPTARSSTRVRNRPCPQQQVAASFPPVAGHVAAGARSHSHRAAGAHRRFATEGAGAAADAAQTTGQGGRSGAWENISHYLSICRHSELD